MAHFVNFRSGKGINLDLVISYDDTTTDTNPAKHYCTVYYNVASAYSSASERWYGADRTEFLAACHQTAPRQAWRPRFPDVPDCDRTQADV